MDYLSLGNNNNNTNNDNNNWETSEREHMFDKVVTPSDVGKLNRLVIPKQHAEKYFPLDSSSTEKGLLLNFEDRNGKSWRFRYSYWNSSQSYVMTKGWSRFVKEKKLDAGDIVSFQRGIGEAARSRLFIDWRRRPNHYHHNLIISNNPSFPIDHHHLHHHRWGYSMPVVPVPTPRNHHESNFLYLGNNGGVVQYPSNYDHHYRHRPQQHHYLAHDNYMSNANVNYGHHVSPILIESLPVASVASATAAPKRLRLFGVNMEYSPNQEDRDQNRRDNDYRHNQISSSSTVQSPPPPHHHHRQVRPIFPIPSTTTSTTSGSNFLAEFSHKGKSSANSLSFDLDP